MKSPGFRLFKQVLPSSAVALALLILCGVASPMRADVYPLCPSSGSGNGYGGDTFTPSGCSITESVPNQTSGYARIAWDSSVAGYPANLTLGGLESITAGVSFRGSDQPFYMLAFTDSTDGLGQASAGDQILLIEFQSSTLTGTGNDTLGLDANTTLFNLYDNTTGVYLNKSLGGQQYTKTLAGWLTADPFLADESLQQVRIGIGMAGGGSDAVSLTINSLEITTPEPTALLLLVILLPAAGWGIRVGRMRRPRA